MATSQRRNLIGILAGNGQFPIGFQFITMELYSCLDQPQLFAGQLSGQYFAVLNIDGCFKLAIPGMNVRKIVMPAVDEIHPDDDPIEH
jgi:hypothetical protein